MTKFVYQNNVSTLLRGDFDGVTLEVALGDGALFPSLLAGEKFEVTIQNAAGEWEIMYCDAVATDDLTISDRQQGGSPLGTWLTGDRAEIRPTAEAMERALQREDDSLTGPLDADGNAITDPHITGGRTIGTDIYASDEGSGNVLSMPDSGGDPTIGGHKIWHEGNVGFTDERYYFPPGFIAMWYKSDPPTGWALCDGSRPAGGPETPDLRARFVMGYNQAQVNVPYDVKVPDGPVQAEIVGDTAGEFARVTDSKGGHDHGGSVSEHILTELELPAHQHRSTHGGNTPGNFGGSGSNAKGGDDGGADSDNIWQHTDWGMELGGHLQLNAHDTPSADPEAHSHSISTDAEHTHTLDKDTMAPYIVLAFIVKLNSSGMMPA